MLTYRFRIVSLPIILASLIVRCAPATPPTSQPDGEPVTGTQPLAGIANPASTYCEEQGGILQLRTDPDGGTYGVCTFSNCTECEEWAYYRGDCTPGMYARAEQGMAGEIPVTLELVYGWRGTVESLPDDPRYDDKLVLCPPETGELGIVGCLPELDDQIDAIRDLPHQDGTAHFWGRLVCGVPDYNGCQFVVERMQRDQPGETFPPDAVEGWLVTLVSTPDCDEHDDALVLAGDFPVRYGIQVMDNDALAAEIDTLRDTDMPFRVWGELTCGVVDAGGCQIRVTQIAMEN